MPQHIALVLALALAQSPARTPQDALPTPESFFGFPIGADRKLAPYQKIVEYLGELERRSPWIRVENLGKTTLGLPHVMAVISTPENLKRAARWQENAAALLDPRITNEARAAELAREGKISVMVTCGIHSDEVAATQTAAELAHDIAANRNLGFDRDAVFKDLILLLVPSVNPDGQEMVADWVAKTAGTDNDGAPMPRLYHVYAGHDDNRDWFAFNLAETRNISNAIYRTWRPQVLVDHHQMGSRGARFFVPPYGDPLNRAVHPLAWRGAALFGQAIAYELEEAGKAGVTHDSYYQGWWEGGLSRAPWWHHGIGILTEAASANYASPVQLDKGELEAGGGLPTITEPLSRLPNPWLGGTWRVRDICDYQRIATFAILKLAAQRAESILRNVHKMASDSIRRGEAGRPFAFVFPSDARDPAARLRLLDWLRLGGVEVRIAGEAFTAGSRLFPAGSAVVSLAQPFGPYAKDMLEDQHYPDYASAQRPYDITGWTLPRMMGVECERIDAPFAPAAGAILAAAPAPKPRFSPSTKGARWLAISPTSNDAFRAAMRAIAEQKALRRAGAPVSTEDGRLFPAGAFLVDAKDVPDGGGWLTSGLAVDVAAIPNDPAPRPAWRVRGPKIGIYEAFDPSMDKGWTLLAVDQYVWRPQLVQNGDVAGALARLDAFVIPESPPEVLWDGGPKSDPKITRVPFPKEYRGGLGAEGVRALRAFVERGGTLVGLGTSCDFLIDRMELPITNVLKGVKREDFACPGSLLRMEFAGDSPIAYGMPGEGAGFFASNVAFKTSPPNVRFGRSTIANFPLEGDLLLSGWLKGEEKLRGASAAVDLTIGKGHVVLLGLRAQHRAQTDATFKLLFNALLLPCCEPE